MIERLLMNQLQAASAPLTASRRPRRASSIGTGVAAATFALLACLVLLTAATTSEGEEPLVVTSVDSAPRPQPAMPREQEVALADMPTGETDHDLMLAVEPTAADFEAGGTGFAANALRMLGDDASQGRFPTGLAIAKVEIGQTGPRGPRQVTLLDIPNVEAVHWNDLLDQMSPIRETVMSGRLDLPPGPTRIRDLVSAAAGLHCGLCLTYAAYGDPVTETRMMGVLWNSVEHRPIAMLHAAADAELAAYKNEIEHNPINAAQSRADWQAARAFEAQLIRAIAGLIARDHPVASTQPSPWINDRPLEPRDLWRIYRPYIRP